MSEPIVVPNEHYVLATKRNILDQKIWFTFTFVT